MQWPTFFTAIILSGWIQVQAVVDFVYDGDTFFAHTKHKKGSVRMLGYDAPEVRNGERARMQAKRLGVSVDSVLTRGIRARDYLRTLLHPGDTILLRISCKDTYGRWLATVGDVNDKMKSRVAAEDGK